MKGLLTFTLFYLLLLFNHARAQNIFVLAGSAVKPPLDEVADEFLKKYGHKVEISYGGSGFVLSQMELTKRGDIYLPASPDFMEKAKKKGLVFSESERILAYLIPAIVVKRGNPKKIRELKDLTISGIRVGIGNPESVCIGVYAVEIFKFNNIPIWKNISAQFESCEKTASALAMGAVDAVIGWDVFGKWYPEALETISLNPSEIPRIAYIPVAVSKFTKNKERSLQFIEFLTGDLSRHIFKKHGYIVDRKEAMGFAPEAKIGGEFNDIELP